MMNATMNSNHSIMMHAHTHVPQQLTAGQRDLAAGRNYHYGALHGQAGLVP